VSVKSGSPHSDPNDHGYFGALYHNSQTNEWVMVNRGTEPSQGKDIFNDLMMVVGKIPQQFDDAQNFYTSIRLRLQREEGTLSVTGHSLGGSLTQLLVAQNQNDAFGNSNLFGVTFNAFGTSALVGKLQPPRSATADYNITNWVVPSDRVGNLAEHIGTVASLSSLPFSFIYPLGPIGVISFVLDSHSIENIHKNFIADNTHPLLHETFETLVKAFVTDPGFSVTIDGSAYVGGNNRLNIGNQLIGGGLNDLMFGGRPDDRIHGGDGQDVIYAGSGNDVLWGDAGADFLLGEDGDDTYHVDDPEDRIIEAAGGGYDTVASTVSYTLSRNVEKLILQGDDAINGTGNELDNVIIGNNANNVLDGGLGADSLVCGGGDDHAEIPVDRVLVYA